MVGSICLTKKYKEMYEALLEFPEAMDYIMANYMLSHIAETDKTVYGEHQLCIQYDMVVFCRENFLIKTLRRMVMLELPL